MFYREEQEIGEKAWELEQVYRNPQIGWDFLVKIAEGHAPVDAERIVRSRLPQSLPPNEPPIHMPERDPIRTAA